MQKKPLLKDLRKQWADTWGAPPHRGLGRTMLEKSLEFKHLNTLTENQNTQLNQVIKQYKRNPRCFDNDGPTPLKIGTQLIRNWKGTRHTITVKAKGFDYKGEHYTSLSKVANDITGTRWNGHVFFGLKK